MKRLLLVAWLVVGLGSTYQAQTLVYDNTVTDTYYSARSATTPIRSAPPPMNTATTAFWRAQVHSITQIQLFMNNPTSDPATADLTIRLYAGDPSLSVNLLWSYTIRPLFVNNQYQPIDYPVPSINLPGNDCTITYELTNFDPNTCPGVGFERFDPPAVGTSEVEWYIRKVNGVWERGEPMSRRAVRQFRAQGLGRRGTGGVPRRLQLRRHDRLRRYQPLCRGAGRRHAVQLRQLRRERRQCDRLRGHQPVRHHFEWRRRTVPIGTASSA